MTIQFRTKEAAEKHLDKARSDMAFSDKAQHTPGPWEVSKDYPLQVKAVNAPSHNTVALFGDFYERPTREANGRLIAAAPELLEALIEAEQMIHAGELNEGTMNIIRAAIAKAKGGAA